MTLESFLHPSLLLSLSLGLLVGISGILVGVLLSRIAREEVLPGKRYFYFFKRIIFVLAGLVMIYYLLEYHYREAFSGNYSFQAFIFMGFIFIVYAVVLGFDLRAEKKINRKHLELVNYTVLLGSYLLLSSLLLSNQLSSLESAGVFASLLFLYGFPAGTIVWSPKTG